MSGMVPGFILDKFRKKRFSGSFKAFTMFVDISGFTSMTQSLMAHGKEGAEIMSGIINDIFTPFIEEIYKNSGFVSSFAGDAFTAIFRLKKAEYVLQSAFAINNIIMRKKSVQTKFGRYPISVKTGLSAGNVSYEIIDAGVQHAYYFCGIAVDKCAESEHHAESMQIVADKPFIESLYCSIKKKRLSDDYFVLTPQSFILPDKMIKKEILPVYAQKLFVPEAVMKLKETGEFREVVSCFISFKTHQRLLSSLRQVIQKCHAYGGYMNRIDFGDKGPSMLVLFGAPTGREDPGIRSADFALALRNIQGFECRTGIASGITYAGFIGSERRREYTAIGGAVNLSARLMTSADPGTIVMDENTAKALPSEYLTDILGLHCFKGFTKKIQVFSLESKIRSNEPITYSGSFIGRKEETDMLAGLISPVLEGRSAGVVYIDGPAGIGKSRFIDNFCRSFNGCRFFYLPCDGILKKPFNPFSRFFDEYFDQDESLNLEKNRVNFENKYMKLVNNTKIQSLQKELIRDISLIGAFMGLEGENSLYLRLDPQKRYENTLYAVKSFFKALSLVKPVVLVMEDCHWIDDDSLELIRTLVRNIEEFPLALILVCRYRDDGSLYDHVKSGDTSISRVEIKPFDKNDISGFLLEKLPGKNVPPSTGNFIMEKSEGNPFFAEQLALYLIENGILDKKNRLKKISYDLPPGINRIILARIDRLSSDIKEIIGTASILGREFALDILKRMLYQDKSVQDEKSFRGYLEKGCKEKIWNAVSELIYIFQHALIRDAVYEIQLKERLRRLHNMAGEIIEEIYENNIKSHFEELADHYYKAQNIEKAVVYLEKAGIQAQDNYQNQKALSCYSRLTGLLDEHKHAEKLLSALIRKGIVMITLSQWKQSIQAFQRAMRLSVKLNQRDTRIRCMYNIGYIHRLMGDIKKAVIIQKDALLIARKEGFIPETGIILSYIGDVYNFQGDYENALKCYSEAMIIAEKIGDSNGISRITGNMAIIFSCQGNHEKALEYCSKSLRIDMDRGFKSGMAANLGNMATVYEQLGDYRKSMEYYQKELDIREELGDRHGISRVLGNMGIIYRFRGDFQKSMDCFQRSLEVKKEIGNKPGIGITLGNIGSLYDQKGDYASAMRYFTRALCISEELMDKRSIARNAGNIGIVYAKQGQYTKALAYFSRLLAISEETGNIAGISAAVNNIGLLHKHQGDYRSALECYSRAMTLDDKLGNQDGKSVALSNIASVYKLQGDYDSGAQYYDRAIKIAREINIKFYLCSYLYEKAELLYLAGKKGARGLNREALQIAVKAGRSDIVFNAEILSCVLDKDSKKLLEMLRNNKLEKEQKAVINYNLYKISQEEQYRRAAIEIYRKLLKKTPKYEYRARINELGNTNT